MKRIYLSPPDVGASERARLLEAFDSNWIAPVGPAVDAFEREFAAAVGVPHAVALSSGTAALHLALVILGVGRGDVVLTPTFNFVATANAIKYVGAEPAFIDVSCETWTLDPDLLEDELRARARSGRQAAAVISVDLYGQSADYSRLADICQRYGVALIEDAAEALGATYRGVGVGQFGECAIFSFNGNKIITTGGGGMLVSRRQDIVGRARYLAAQAKDSALDYHHAEIGYNYRLSNLLAAVGSAQLESLSQKVDRRRSINAAYRQRLAGLPGIEFMPEALYGRSSCWLTCITVTPSAFGATGNDIRLALESQNIESRTLWKPMHLQPAFGECAIRGSAVAEDIFERGLCLPSGSSLSEAEQTRVVDGILATPGRLNRSVEMTASG